MELLNILPIFSNVVFFVIIKIFLIGVCARGSRSSEQVHSPNDSNSNQSARPGTPKKMQNNETKKKKQFLRKDSDSKTKLQKVLPKQTDKKSEESSQNNTNMMQQNQQGKPIFNSSDVARTPCENDMEEMKNEKNKIPKTPGKSIPATPDKSKEDKIVNGKTKNTKRLQPSSMNTTQTLNMSDEEKFRSKEKTNAEEGNGKTRTTAVVTNEDEPEFLESVNDDHTLRGVKSLRDDFASTIIKK